MAAVEGLEIRDLVVEYSSGGYAVRPLDGLDLSVPTGELVLLLGASGCGKTTLLSALAAILSPTSPRRIVLSDGPGDDAGAGGKPGGDSERCDDRRATAARSAAKPPRPRAWRAFTTQLRSGYR